MGWRRTAFAAAVVTVALTAVAVGAKRTPPVDAASARAEARALVARGNDAAIELRYADAFASYRAALLRDPTYMPALFQIVTDIGSPVGARFIYTFFDSLAARVTDAAVAECFTRWSQFMRGVAPGPVTYPLVSDAVRDCAEWLRWSAWTLGMRDHTMDATRALRARHPDVPAVVASRIHSETPHSLWAGAAREGELQTGMRFHPLVRALAYSEWSHALRRMGREDAAIAADRRARSDPAWSLPGFRARYYHAFVGQGTMTSMADRGAGFRERLQAAVSAAGDELRASVSDGDQLRRAVFTSGYGQRVLDEGKLELAMQLLQRAAALTDSVGDPALRAFARTRLGRAYVKLGRLADGERELLAARQIQFGDTAPLTQKETAHNLLHLYESLGDYARARQAGEEYVRHAALGGLHSGRMMSNRDLGRLLRTHGDFEASRRHFERMLADIDSLAIEWHFAAEYFEVTGDLERARSTYLRGVVPGATGTRALEGLVRVSLALADTAGALRIARAHDARRTSDGFPESAALMPGLLAQMRRFDDARAAFATARADVLRSGQVAAWAALTLQFAELEHAQHSASRAASLADSAAAAARRVASSEVAVRAGALGALARLEAAPARRDMLVAIATAVREAERAGYPSLRADMRRMRAEAQAIAGDWRGALASYGSAADLTDSIASVIPLDQAQAAYRSAQRRVYSGALAVVIAHAAASDAPALFAQWSRRRKSLAIVAPGRAHAALPRAGRAQAIVDYALLDSVVGALVVTAHGARVVPLATPGDSLRAMLRRFRSALDARVGGMVDISRAQYPEADAHALYRALVAPLAPHLAGISELFIVPDGALHLIPFDALVVEPAADRARDSRATYLFDRYTVTESATVDADVSASPLPAGPVVAIAPSLRGALQREAEREVNALTLGIDRDRVVRLTGAAATERAVREHAPRAVVLHFASHARANESDPSLSSLTLVRDADDDGVLHAYEVAALRLDAALIVLSACETATGRTLDGEGVMSLSRTFLRSGARATVATLWPVGAGSAGFMQAFYAALAARLPPAEALKRAKVQLRDRGVPAFVWAPYKVVTRAAPSR